MAPRMACHRFIGLQPPVLAVRTVLTDNSKGP